MDLQTTNIWLAILAICSVVQLLAVCVVVFVVMRVVKRAEGAIDLVTRDMQPIVQRVQSALDDLKDMTARLKRADEAITAKLEGMAAGVDRLKVIALTRVWPAVGVARGLRAAAAALRERRRARERREDINAEHRFMNEGGAHAGPVRS